MQSYDVLVVGGGIVGLTAALAMAKKGFTVGLLDSGNIENAPSNLRVYAINKESRQFLEQLQVWSLLDLARISPYQHMHVWDGVNGSAIDFDSRMSASSSLGVILEESVLKSALLQAIEKEKAISLIPHTTVDKLQQLPDRIEVYSDEKVTSCHLLIVADGANSPLRKLLQVPVTTWSYQQNALVATIKTAKAHQQTAWQIFNPGGPLAFLPLVDENKCSIVWSTTPERAKALLAMSKEEFNCALGKAFNWQLGEVSLESERIVFPLTMRHANQYSGDRWLLVGDAAHTIHPLAGLGLNLGLADVKTWINCLENKGNKALGAYQRQCKTEVWKIIALMEGFKRLFSNDLGPVVAIRGLGLKLCNQLPIIKRFFITQASG